MHTAPAFFSIRVIVVTEERYFPSFSFSLALLFLYIVMNSAVELSIDLLPEFGWRINGEPVYSPGSIFEGNYTIILFLSTIKSELSC